MRDFRLLLSACLLLAFALATADAAPAARRLALVIGNGAYRAVPALDNPPNDAADLAKALRSAGFDVTELRDGTRESMVHAVGDFVGRLQPSDTALFFYAGHGLQVNGENYLIPVDAKIEKPVDVRFDTIDLNDVQQEMNGVGSTNIIVLDACRNNPFADVIAHGQRGGAVRGFGRMDAAGAGSLIVFSTQPNNVSLDGTGRNSPFTAALLKHIATPGLEIRQMLSRVRGDVLAATNHRQMPWDNSSLVGDVYLTGAAPVEGTNPPVAAAVPDGVKVATLPSQSEPVPNRSLPPDTAAEAKPQEPKNDCDRLAALRVPFSSPQAVHEIKETDWQQAADACEAMVAANPNEPRFRYQLGRAYDNLKDYPKAVHNYRLATSGDFAEAWTDLGVAYYQGHGVVQSYKMAFDMFTKAAPNSPRALAYLSSMYNDGRGVPKDNLKSLDLAEKAVDAGNPFGLYVIAIHYFNGFGVAQDYPMTAQYMQQAADLGDGKSMKFLANMYESGYLGAPNPAKAAQLRLRADEVDPQSRDPEPAHLPMLRRGVAQAHRATYHAPRRYVVYRRIYRFGGCAYVCW